MLESISKNKKKIKNDWRCSPEAQTIFKKLRNPKVNRERIIILNTRRRGRKSSKVQRISGQAKEKNIKSKHELIIIWLAGSRKSKWTIKWRSWN